MPWEKLGVAVLVLLVWASWLMRYDMKVGSAGGQGVAPIAYVLDRWTGETRMLFPGGVRVLKRVQQQ